VQRLNIVGAGCRAHTVNYHIDAASAGLGTYRLGEILTLVIDHMVGSKTFGSVDLVVAAHRAEHRRSAAFSELDQHNTDATRRGDYERFWLRALGPFERVSPLHPELLPPAEPEVRTVPLAAPANGHDEPPAVAPQAASVPAGLEGLTAALRDAARVLEDGAALDRRLQGDAGIGGIAGFLARVERALASVRREELDALRAEAQTAIARLESEQRVLAALASMRRKVEPVRLAS